MGSGSGASPSARLRLPQNDRLGVEKVQNTAPPAWEVMLVNACSGSDHPQTETSSSSDSMISTYSAVLQQHNEQQRQFTRVIVDCDCTMARMYATGEKQLADARTSRGLATRWEWGPQLRSVEFGLVSHVQSGQRFMMNAC